MVNVERQYTASVFVIDFENKEILLMYNKKIKKWLQPGGHIEGTETPIDTVKRECLEETGVNIEIIGPSFDNVNFEPIGLNRYINTVGDMIDIQYLGIPLNKNLGSIENNESMWLKIDELNSRKDIDDEIKIKVCSLYGKYKMY